MQFETSLSSSVLKSQMRLDTTNSFDVANPRYKGVNEDITYQGDLSFNRRVAPFILYTRS